MQRENERTETRDDKFVITENNECLVPEQGRNIVCVFRNRLLPTAHGKNSMAVVRNVSFFHHSLAIQFSFTRNICVCE